MEIERKLALEAEDQIRKIASLNFCSGTCRGTEYKDAISGFITNCETHRLNHKRTLTQFATFCSGSLLTGINFQTTIITE